mmetsp:Transcript_1446/g.3409  ORF Transcript_1446/g.3409 Transcript_1446/m.3409 type:complete len:94 (+) Transcript_1446:177-458(+)
MRHTSASPSNPTTSNLDRRTAVQVLCSPQVNTAMRWLSPAARSTAGCSLGFGFFRRGLYGRKHMSSHLADCLGLSAHCPSKTTVRLGLLGYFS